MIEILIVLTSILIILVLLDLIMEARSSIKNKKLYEKLKEIEAKMRELKQEEISNKIFFSMFYDSLNESKKRLEQYGQKVEFMETKLKRYLLNMDEE